MFASKPLQNDFAMVSAIRDLIGQEAILLPVRWGQKRPLVTGWQNFTSAKMEDLGYLESLRGVNLGVLMGQASNGLCSIDVDSDEGAEEFERLNPMLKGTLQTKGARGCNFWVKIQGDYPQKLQPLKQDEEHWGEFRSNGGYTIIHGMHPSGVMYQTLNEHRPIELGFDEIAWPESLTLPWIKDAYDLLVEKEGPLLASKPRGGYLINQSCLAGKYILENRLVFEPAEQEFYLYTEDGGLYRQVSEAELGEEILRDIQGMADEIGDSNLSLLRTPKMGDSVVKLLKGKLGQTGRDAFKRNSQLMHVKNGVIEITKDGGRLLGFHPEYRSRTALPLECDPNAGCPRFLEEFLRPVLCDDDIRLLQEYFGGVLLGRNLSQRILILKGAAGSGKSTLLNILEEVIGRHNVSELRMKHLGDRFELYAARASLLLAGKDVGSDFLNSSNAGILKKLCGGDQVGVEKKGGDQFSIMGEFHIVIATNTQLQVKLDGDYDAWARRLAMIEFQPRNSSSAVIPKLAQILLKEEGSGILNFFLEGAMRLLENLENGGMRLTPAQQARVDGLLLESDSVCVFVEEALISDAGHEITSDVLHTGYADFCEAKGWEPKPSLTFAKDVAPLIRERFDISKRNDIHGSRRGYKDINVKTNN